MLAPTLPLLLLLLQARHRVRQVSLTLLHSWRPTDSAASSKDSTAPKQHLNGVEPGAFPRTLLEARDKDTEQPLSGEQVGAQQHAQPGSPLQLLVMYAISRHRCWRHTPLLQLSGHSHTPFCRLSARYRFVFVSMHPH